MALTDGLVAYYKFDGDATDSVGSNNGTVYGATVTTSGKINQAYSFDGINDYIGLPGTLINNDSYGTISMWIKLNVSANQAFFSKQANNVDSMLIFQTDSSSKLQFKSDNGSGTTNGTTVLTTGVWYNVIAVRNNTIQKIYVNGVEDGSISADTSIRNNTSTIAIGAWIGDGNNYASIIIDEIGIWNRALTASEVSELYNNGNGKSYPFTTPSGSNNKFFTLHLGAEF